MKTQNFSRLTSILLVVLMFVASDAFAQRGRANYGPHTGRAFDEMPDRTLRQPGFCGNLPGITDEQLEKIDAIRLNTMKKNQQLQNQLGEKRAQLRTYSTSDQVDMSAINQTIDKIAAIRSELMKNRLASNQEIRNLLNEDQRVVFDSRKPGRKGYGSGRHQGNIGRGPGFRGDCPYRK